MHSAADSRPAASHDNGGVLARCFVAYPSVPIDRAESVEEAIEELQSGKVVDIVGWKSLTISGRVVITAICDEIKKRDLFIADVTGLNPNVLFELGYAIAHRKRIWLLLNPRIEHAKSDFERFQLLTTVGYSPYDNSNDIVTRFYRDEPYNNLGQDLYKELLAAAGPATKKDALLYLRCDIDTEASMRLARRVTAGPISSIIDDPKEVRRQPLSWYIQHVTASFAVVCHFLSSQYQDWELHNAKHALVAGLAHGLGKPLLMLAHEPYSSPLDYRDLLHPHKTAARAESIFSDWLLPLVEQYEKRKASAAIYREAERAHAELRDIRVGDPVAENESDFLLEYYVSTAAYLETLNARYSIVVGRKGTGKTAMLVALENELAADPRNHVCTIRPVGYELEGLLNLLQQELSRAEKGYLVESFWKFLLYTELAKSIYDQLLGKPEYYVRTAAEVALCEFVEQQKSLITPEFSTRLEGAVSRLRDLRSGESAQSNRLKISEMLHNDMLSHLRVLLGAALQPKAKVAVLVDNLDKAWNPNGNLPLLSELLFGLLAASRRAAEEFARDASGRASANLYFALFLRSDIYAAMLHFAKERDKLPVRLIAWDDPEQLKRVIELRFLASAPEFDTPDKVWERFFVPTTSGIPTWEFISAQILPRPRDLVFYIKSALQSAVNAGRTQIHEGDFKKGSKLYSRFALDSLIVEAAVKIPKVEELLVNFVQSSEIVGETELIARMTASGIPESDFDLVVNSLCQLTFLGFEVAPYRFEFLYDERDAPKFSAMAAKTAASTTNGIRRFRIHPAYHAFLEIEPSRIATPGQLDIDLKA